MRLFSVTLSAAGALLLTLPAAAASLHPHHRASTYPMVRHSAATHSVHHVEQRSYEHASMSSERATEIQTALIKQGYLTGDPTGSWDSSSISAMQRMQSDNGWQTKLVPDSRALIKLGLGPGTEPATTTTTATTTSTATTTAAVTSAYEPATN